MKRFYASILAVSAAIAFNSFPAGAVPKGCVFYEPGEVTLKGILRHSTVWTLELDKTVCIEGKEKDMTGMYPTEDAIKTAFLLARKETPLEKYMDLVDKDVVLTGTLYHKYDISADQVMMNVGTVALANQENIQAAPNK